MAQRWQSKGSIVLGFTVLLTLTACGGRPEVEVKEEGLTYEYVSGEQTAEALLLELPIEGVILNRSSGGLDFGGATYGYEVQRLLERVSKDDKVKGIFLRLSTPGGTITGSDAVYKALVTYKKATKKPVVAYVEGLSASGGVYSMVGADVIYAAPGSFIGSVGVIGPQFLYYDAPIALKEGGFGSEITTRNGIQQIIISAGKGKDLGNPFRRPTEEELQVLRNDINVEYANFVQLVSKARGIPEQTLRQQMGAYIFSNKTAQQYKLIDATKDRPDAIADLAKRAKVDKYQVVTVNKPNPGFFNLFGSSKENAPTLEQQRQIVQQDICAAVSSQTAMAYHGDITQLCPDRFAK